MANSVVFSKASVIDFYSQSNVPNPPAGYARLYFNGTNLVAINSSGSNVISGGGGGGSVTSFSSGDLSPLFTTSVANPTATPALSFALTNAGANTVLGNATGSLAAPSYSQIVTGQVSTGAITDTQASLLVKPSVGLVATSNLTLSGAQTIDGVAGAAGTTLVLATAQSTGSQNGPWVMQSSAWTRPTWYPSGGTTQALQFSTIFVRLGTAFQGSVWRLTTANPITIDTTATTWAQTPMVISANSVVAGVTGSGAVVLATSPTLVTPALGTPSSGVLSSCTGYPTSALTGLGTGVATWLATPSSANLASAVTDETGSGSLVFATSPTLTTPTIADFTNANHNHQNAAGGGSLSAAAIGSGTLATARGGTNLDTSASTGIAQVSSGTWSASDTLSRATTISAAGAASASAVTLTGAVFTGGTGTTTFPYFYINQGASGPSAFNTNGCEIGINAASGFTGRFLDFHINGGGTVFNVGSTGGITSNSDFTFGVGGSKQIWSGRSVIQSPSDGVFEISNNAITDFGRLQFGGTTSSFPAIKRSSATLLFRLADDSADAGIGASTVALSGRITTYNGFSTVGGGVPAQVALIAFTGQSAAVTTSTLYAVPASGAGTYRITVYAKITTAASVSSALGGTNGYQLTWTDASDSTTPTATLVDLTTLSLSANTTTTVYSGTLLIDAKASTNIQHAFDYTSAGGTAMQYKLNVRVEYLG